MARYGPTVALSLLAACALVYAVRQSLKATDFDNWRNARRATVTLDIEKHYVNGDMVPTTVTATIPLPPPQSDIHAYETWKDVHIHNYTGTGTGRSGDAGYFVEITASTVPALIGQRFEFGV